MASYSEFLPGQEVSFRTDRYTYPNDEDVRFTIRTKFVDTEKFKPQITLLRPTGETVHLDPAPVEGDPGLYRITYRPEEEGEFRADLNDLTGNRTADQARFTVYTDVVETRFVASDRDLLRRIADTTGGALIALDDLSSLPDRITAFESLTKEDLKPIDIWDRWYVYAALLALFALEWFTRRRAGLV